jgi:uncharacterized heparinase superfamily protein
LKALQRLGAAPVGAEASTRAAAWAEVLGRLVRRQGQAEWFGSPFHLMTLRGLKPDGIVAAPKEARPAGKQMGEAILTGLWRLGGDVMALGAGGDPWDKPSPSRRFAEPLHRFDWLPSLLSTGEPGEREALRLTLDWRRVFGRWNTFSWGADILERRTVRLACGLRAITRRASDAETALLADLLARHGRQLLMIKAGPARAAERACAAALAGAALGGPAGEQLMAAALAALAHALPVTVLADGGHASRSPQAGLDLLLDLLTLDDGLSQRGRAPPEEMSRAIDRLGASLRVLATPDGRLASFQGGEAGKAVDIAAARAALDMDAGAAVALPYAGYQRLAARSLTVVADAAAPATGAWSEAACAQPLAIEVFSGVDRLITGCAWSPRAGEPQALRLTAAASTVSVGDASAGEPDGGRLARLLGSRLKGGPANVAARRHESPQGAWLEMSHDGWVASWGLKHERMLYLDLAADELRGEERLVPNGPAAGSGRVAPVAVRFHLHPDVRASLARDRRSVLLQGPTSHGWWLRNDAGDVSIEPSVHYENGLPRRSTQVVLRSQMPAGHGGRIRWKLTAAEVG